MTWDHERPFAPIHDRLPYDAIVDPPAPVGPGGAPRGRGGVPPKEPNL
jgi:hypothetical protein